MHYKKSYVDDIVYVQYIKCAKKYVPHAQTRFYGDYASNDMQLIINNARSCKEIDVIIK